MPGRNGQRKPGTTRGSPRRSRTAKASRISRHAVKSRCACEWGGWGRLSDDGPGQHNPDPSEGPWGGGLPTLQGGARSSPRPDTVRDYRCDHEVHEGRRQTGRRSAYAGSRLKPIDASGRRRLTCQPSSRTGENPPYGMIGGIEETSASFEARSAPRYPLLRWKQSFGKASNNTWSASSAWCACSPVCCRGGMRAPRCHRADSIAGKLRRGRPYIYSEAEVARIVARASTLPSRYGMPGWWCSTLFGLIAVTGLRINEAIALDDENLNDGVVRRNEARTGRLRRERSRGCAPIAPSAHGCSGRCQVRSS